MKVNVKKSGKIVIPVKQGDTLYIEEEKNSVIVIFPKKDTQNLPPNFFAILKVLVSLCLLLLLGIILTQIITNTNAFEIPSYISFKDFIVNIIYYLGMFLFQIITIIFKTILYIGFKVVGFIIGILLSFGAFLFQITNVFGTILYIGLILLGIIVIIVTIAILVILLFKIIKNFKNFAQKIGGLIQDIFKFIQIINWKIVSSIFILVLLGSFVIGIGITNIFGDIGPVRFELSRFIQLLIIIFGILAITIIFEIIKRFAKKKIGFLKLVWKLILSIVFTIIFLLFFQFFISGPIPKPDKIVVTNEVSTSTTVSPQPPIPVPTDEMSTSSTTLLPQQIVVNEKIGKIKQILNKELNDNEEKALLGGKSISVKGEDKEVCIQADIKAANTCVVQIMSDYHWIYKTEKISSQNISDETENFKNRLSKTDMQTLFDMTTDVILVGVASQEGNPIQEKERASRRAKKLAELIEKSRKKLPNLHILNLGQYKSTSEMNTSTKTIEQRKVILIGIEKNNMTLESLLNKCVEQCWDNEESTYAIKPSDYLEYELHSYE